MLNNPAFKQKITEHLRTYLDNNDGSVNPVILWDAAKAVLHGFIISETAFAKKKAKQKKLLELQKQLLEIEKQHSETKNPQFLLQMRPLKQEIDKIYSEEVEKKLRFTKQ